ncbi:GTPase-activating protein SAC7 [Madurella mycetomatis]|uniref:GTPase-activating protein SAC7 n=1 Tax=Madurella mycetomatis TaxID=100816 RepID=A0A175VZ23_9PEZI|nr:GTPase-activating protein SAC7 [Madurella mycetomatis]KXX79640.1 GTPase-activating protein SAC7 [Madurella mycetomatis]
MTDILDGGLREQLAAALLGWGGGDGDGNHGTSRGIDDGDGHRTPKATPAVAQIPGYIRYPMQIDEGDRRTVNDDIDADSIMTRADSIAPPSDSRRHTEQQSYSAGQSLQAIHKALPSLPGDVALASPEPEISCRISRFPFSHPCEVPELMPDQDDVLNSAASPSASGPATPSVANDVFRPLTQFRSFDLNLAPLPSLGPSPELTNHRTRQMSMGSILSDASASDGLEIIQEEEGGDLNEDGVSLMTPTEASSGKSSGDDSSTKRARQQFLTVGNHSHAPSVSSLGSASASASSGDWRPSNTGVARKSASLFSLIRSGSRPPVEEECLERRCLTPLELTTPPRVPGQPDEPSPSPSSSTTLREAHTGSKFFQRMPWLGDAEPKKPQAVFGVDLKDSIRVAPMKIRISHKGRSTSYRTFPLSVYKCCEFIRRAGTYRHSDSRASGRKLTALGGTDGNIFSSPGDAYNVSSLKDIFNQPPSYGEKFQFEGSDYTVHDAARLILLFLEELPKPLISQSVVRSWILLARQAGAIEPPCPRVENGLDFWTEALNRLPTASRNLTKQLLTVFAEVLLAASGDISEADARQLASAVSRAMFHQDTDASVLVSNHDTKSKEQKRKSAKRNVHPTLALAYLIRKRGEYAISLSKASGNGAHTDSKLFLPSTREMLEWKGGQ